MTTDQEVELSVHICPECSNMINDMHDHHSDCPVLTNYWEVEYGGELLCYLCDGWLIEGDHYRMIPYHMEMDDDDILESSIGKPDTMALRPVCLHCSRLRIVYRAPVGTDPTPALKGAQNGS